MGDEREHVARSGSRLASEWMCARTVRHAVDDPAKARWISIASSAIADGCKLPSLNPFGEDLAALFVSAPTRFRVITSIARGGPASLAGREDLLAARRACRTLARGPESRRGVAGRVARHGFCSFVGLDLSSGRNEKPPYADNPQRRALQASRKHTVA